MQNKLLEETFGPDVPAAIKRNEFQTWTIENALQTEWTLREKNPPDTLDKQGWTRKLPLTLGSVCSHIVDRALARYNTYSPSHTVKRLTRYGLPILMKEWEEEIADARQYRQAGNELADYIEGNPDQYSLTKEERPLNVDFGRSTGEQERWSVIWFQKLLIARISDDVGMTEADVLRRIILEGGKALGEKGIIKEPGLKNITQTADEVDAELNKRVTNIKRPVRGILFEALLSDYRREVAELCQNEFPRLWNEFEEAAQAADNPEPSGFLEDVNF